MEFKLFDYELYQEMIDKITSSCKQHYREDIEQDLFLYLINLENRILTRKGRNFSKLLRYIFGCLNNKYKKLIKKYAKMYKAHYVPLEFSNSAHKDKYSLMYFEHFVENSKCIDSELRKDIKKYLLEEKKDNKKKYYAVLQKTRRRFKKYGIKYEDFKEES